MDAGVGTPLAGNVYENALSAKGGAVLLSGKSSAPDSRVSSSGGFHEQADQVDLSSEARARLRNDHQALVSLQQGRGEPAAQDDTSSGEEPYADLNVLRDRVLEASPAQRKSFKELIEELQEHFKDEDRIPPSIYNQIRYLLEKSLSDGPSGNKEGHIDALA